MCIDDTLALEEYKKYVKADITGAAKDEQRVKLVTSWRCGDLIDKIVKDFVDAKAAKK